MKTADVPRKFQIDKVINCKSNHYSDVESDDNLRVMASQLKFKILLKENRKNEIDC